MKHGESERVSMDDRYREAALHEHNKESDSSRASRAITTAIEYAVNGERNKAKQWLDKAACLGVDKEEIKKCLLESLQDTLASSVNASRDISFKGSGGISLEKKFNVAIEAIKGRIDKPSLVKLTNISGSEIASYERHLMKNGIQVFAQTPLETAVSALATSGKINIIQIGANDGKSEDPVHDIILNYAKKAVLVEPISDLIHKIENNYKYFEGELHIENAAVASHSSSSMKIYFLKKDSWDEYMEKWGKHPTLIASQDIETVARKIAERLALSREEAEKRISTITPNIISIEDIIKKHNIDSVDLLQIDAEGYDFEIIKTIKSNFPKIINFESMNLTRRDWREFARWANDNNYGYFRGKQDTMAIKNAKFKCE